MANQQTQVQPTQNADMGSVVLPAALSGTIVIAIAGFLAKWAFDQIIGQWQHQLQELRAEIKILTADQVVVKTEYVSKEEFLRVTTRFEFHIDRLGEKIDKLLER